MSIITVGLDLAKHVFQVYAVDETGKAIIRKKLRRSEVLEFFQSLSPCLIGMEACGTAHHWARELIKLGHYPADAGRLCQAVRQARQERRPRCGGNLRGGHATDHALCGREKRRAAVGFDSPSDARIVRSSANHAGKFLAWPTQRVRFDCAEGRLGAFRNSTLSHRAPAGLNFPTQFVAVSS